MVVQGNPFTTDLRLSHVETHLVLKKPGESPFFTTIWGMFFSATAKQANLSELMGFKTEE